MQLPQRGLRRAGIHSRLLGVGHHGGPKAQAYNLTMYVMAGLLVIGFFCNLFVKDVNERHHMKAVDADAEVEGAPVFGGSHGE